MRASIGTAMVATALAVAPVIAAPMVWPDPVEVADPTVLRTELVDTEVRGNRWERLHIVSESMRRVVPVDVLRGAGNAPRPTLYLLDGVEAEATSDWITQGGAREFFADKPVDVVLTSGGMGSMYTDWHHYDAKLGLNRWETFLTEELPPIVEDYLGGNGHRAIAGVSMGAQGAVMIAQRHPGQYRAVAGMSGCYSTADELGRAITRITVGSRGGNVDNLWGPPTSPDWLAHDSLLGAEQLRGTTIHLSVASGMPGPANLIALAQAPDIADALGKAGGGVALEAGARSCTERFAQRLAQLGIPATVHYAPAGLHAWPDFAAQLEPAWRTLAGALDVAAE
ncbi:esterase family protein [Nocardia otitidiscaviarum]|nr:alpha/beta hydrolase family protein [Nocardia otitidiscaviarum]MCP9625053.1 esterase family protein [Nocardia otitidiscaviarum]